MQKKERIISNQFIESKGEKIFCKGWLHNLRSLGKIMFALVRDEKGVFQVVVEDKELISKLEELQPGSILYISAEVQATENTELGVELINPEIEVVNAVKDSWPIEINKPELNASLDVILENRALSLRHEKLQAVFKIQATMAQAYREYMVQNGFVEFFGPAMLASSSEGGAEVFKLDYFDKGQATLAQSNQLYKQIMVGAYGKVFGMAKWFRAENSNTRRHLTEGMQYEFEMGFIDDYKEVMLEAESVIRHMLRAAGKKNEKELSLLGKELVKTPKDGVEFPKLTFAQAAKIVAEKTGEDTSSWDDLSTEAERVLCDYVREVHGTDFVWVTNIPKGAFYAYKDEQGKFYNFDLLCREAEVISGGRRIDNYEKMVESIKSAGMNPESFGEYLSIFKYGMPPHGGFGLGFERFTMQALGLENIREATLFPSDPKRVAAQYLQKSSVYGAEKIKKNIKQLFVEAGVGFQVLTHEPTPTSEDAAKVREMELSEGVKALILRNKKSGENILVAIPADKKLDMKQFKDFEFEKPEIIMERYGLEVGGIPPFGEVFALKTYVDESVFSLVKVGFNNADKSESILCSGEALSEVLDGELGVYISN
ncbi:MAG: aspartate--tRNA(Asn) ligase [Candidatus Dojkabacteria bacterium]